MYNIEVEAEHCYFVGDGEVLSHNSCLDIVQKYGGKQQVDDAGVPIENRFDMPNKKAAKQAASEIAGNLGSDPTTLRLGGPEEARYGDAEFGSDAKNSNRRIGAQSADQAAGHSDHFAGHRFDRRSHVNAWSARTGTTKGNNAHLYYPSKPAKSLRRGKTR